MRVEASKSIAKPDDARHKTVGASQNLSSLKGCKNKAQGKRSAALGVRSRNLVCPVGAPQNGIHQYFSRSFKAPIIINP